MLERGKMDRDVVVFGSGETNLQVSGVRNQI